MYKTRGKNYSFELYYTSIAETFFKRLYRRALKFVSLFDEDLPKIRSIIKRS